MECLDSAGTPYNPHYYDLFPTLIFYAISPIMLFTFNLLALFHLLLCLPAICTAHNGGDSGDTNTTKPEWRYISTRIRCMNGVPHLDLVIDQRLKADRRSLRVILQREAARLLAAMDVYVEAGQENDGCAAAESYLSRIWDSCSG